MLICRLRRCRLLASTVAPSSIGTYLIMHSALVRSRWATQRWSRPKKDGVARHNIAVAASPVMPPRKPGAHQCVSTVMSMPFARSVAPAAVVSVRLALAMMRIVALPFPAISASSSIIIDYRAARRRPSARCDKRSSRPEKKAKKAVEAARVAATKLTKVKKRARVKANQTSHPRLHHPRRRRRHHLEGVSNPHREADMRLRRLRTRAANPNAPDVRERVLAPKNRVDVPDFICLVFAIRNFFLSLLCALFFINNIFQVGCACSFRAVANFQISRVIHFSFISFNFDAQFPILVLHLFSFP